MRKTSLVITIFCLCLFGCKSDTPTMAGSRMLTEEDVLVKAGFTDDSTYRIVCKGYPMEGLSGVSAEKSSMESAKMNAMYFVNKYFGNAVDPGINGDVEHYEMRDTYAIVHFVVKKKGLKKLYNASAGKK